MEKRNLHIRDVCLSKDSSTVQGEWRICQVLSVYPNENGLVRNFEVKVVPVQLSSADYKPFKPNHLKRHVSNLIVLVPAGDQ